VVREAAADPDARLAALLGPRFAKYRRDFKAAESGIRPPAPLHLDVDVTTACQLACPMCPAGGSFESDFPGMGLFLDEKLYQEALREAERLSMPSIRLGMTGEPLLISDIDRWAMEAKAAGFIDLALITNGQLLSAEKSTLLIEAGLTKLMVSVDAACPETYAKMRPGGDFERLVENIEDFLAVRFAKNSRLPLLRLSFVVSSLNKSEIEAFRAKFSTLADWLVFQDYLSLSPDPSLAPADLERPGKDLSPARCPDPLARMALLSDGGLFPCCSDFARLAPLGRMPRDSIESVWRSQAAESLAANLDHPSCRKCLAASSRGKPNMETTAAKREVRGQRSATC
jgi:hypothetical protein